MAAAGGACDLKLGRERGAVHRPVFCKRARVIKMSARDIFLAGDPLWALASAFSPVAGSLSRVRVSPAALARALFRRVPSDPEGQGVRSQHTPPSASPGARLGWSLAAAAGRSGPHTGLKPLIITSGPGDVRPQSCVGVLAL